MNDNNAFSDCPVTVTATATATNIGLSKLRAQRVEDGIRHGLGAHFGDGKKRKKRYERELRKGNHRTSVFDSWNGDSSVLSMISLYFAVYVRACAGTPSSWIAANDINEDDAIEIWMSEIADIAEGFARLSHMMVGCDCEHEDSVDEFVLRVYVERMLKVLPHM